MISANAFLPCHNALKKITMQWKRNGDFDIKNENNNNSLFFCVAHVAMQFFNLLEKIARIIYVGLSFIAVKVANTTEILLGNI
jgi:hypothetical protein